MPKKSMEGSQEKKPGKIRETKATLLERVAELEKELEVRDQQIEAFREQTGAAIETIENQDRLIKGLETHAASQEEELRRRDEEIKRIRLDDAERERLVWEAHHDPTGVTQLMNRKGFEEMVLGPVNPSDGMRGGGSLDKFRTSRRSREETGERWGKEYVVMLLDIDHFKKFNDTYGHDVGDRALATFAEALDHFVRDRDVVARWGGEEFVIQMITRNRGDRVRVATRLLETLRRLRVSVEETVSGKTTQRLIPLTASIGVAKLGEGEDFEGLLKRADQAVYKAKEAGRNRMAIPDDEE